VSDNIDALARKAADGDRDALTELVRELQHPMYRLALRFLGDPRACPARCVRPTCWPTWSG
jgi:DNA-directed RNA polymerase specialized sigma24 family protein